MRNMNEKESIEKEQQLLQMIKAVLGRREDPEVSEENAVLKIVTSETFILVLSVSLVQDDFFCLSGCYM